MFGNEQRAFAQRNCGPPRFREESQIQNSKFKIQNYGIEAQPAEGTFEADLRDASCVPPPPPGCSPPTSYEVDAYPQPARSRADGPAFELREKSSPPPGGGCGRPAAARPSPTPNTPRRTAGRRS